MWNEDYVPHMCLFVYEGFVYFLAFEKTILGKTPWHLLKK